MLNSVARKCLEFSNFQKILLRKSLIGFPFAEFSSAKVHMNKSHHNEKTYRRIWPAAKHLMKVHNIQDEEIPKEIKVVMKEHILDILEKNKAKRDQITRKSSSTTAQSTSKVTQSKTPVILSSKVYDDFQNSKESLDWVGFKQKLPHKYFNNTVQVDNLIAFIDEINSKHKKNLKMIDFLAKVK
jgi:hypothetical protein